MIRIDASGLGITQKNMYTIFAGKKLLRGRYMIFSRMHKAAVGSDISIFHEVTEEHATFFREGDATALAQTIRTWIDEAVHPDSTLISTHTWRESAEAIRDILDGKTRPYKVVG